MRSQTRGEIRLAVASRPRHHGLVNATLLTHMVSAEAHGLQCHISGVEGVFSHGFGRHIKRQHLEGFTAVVFGGLSALLRGIC